MDILIPEGLAAGKPWFYEFKGGGSDKFWGGFQDGPEIVCVWGRNGRPPQGSKRMSLHSFAAKANEKTMKHGYSPAALDLEALFLGDKAWFAKAEVSPGFRAAMEAAELAWEIGAGPSAGKKARRL